MENGESGYGSGFGLEGVQGLCGDSGGVVVAVGSCGLVLNCAVNPLQFLYGAICCC